MRKDEVPDRPSASLALPEVLVVEVAVQEPDARARGERIAAIRKVSVWGATSALALSVAMLALGGPMWGRPNGARHGVSPLAGEPGAAGVAAAYGHALRCLSITILTTDSRYARADFDRASPCGRYTGYSTAIFHRVKGMWRPVLEAVGYVCPVASLPVAVQTGLDVCPKPTTRPPAVRQ
jgi:hypothetical protein